jgi:hypothetical protein
MPSTCSSFVSGAIYLLSAHRERDLLTLYVHPCRTSDRVRTLTLPEATTLQTLCDLVFSITDIYPINQERMLLAMLLFVLIAHGPLLVWWFRFDGILLTSPPSH